MAAVAVGCATVCTKRSQAIAPAEYDETIRVACVGDSITFGASIKDRENNNYPVVFGRSLGEKFDVRHFGVSGAWRQVLCLCSIRRKANGKQDQSS